MFESPAMFFLTWTKTFAVANRRYKRHHGQGGLMSGYVMSVKSLWLVHSRRVGCHSLGRRQVSLLLLHGWWWLSLQSPCFDSDVQPAWLTRCVIPMLSALVLPWERLWSLGMMDRKYRTSARQRRQHATCNMHHFFWFNEPAPSSLY